MSLHVYMLETENKNKSSKFIKGQEKKNGQKVTKTDDKEALKKGKTGFSLKEEESIKCIQYCHELPSLMS